MNDDMIGIEEMETRCVQLADAVQALMDSGADLNAHRSLVAEYLMCNHQCKLMREGKIVSLADGLWSETTAIGAAPIRR